MFIIKNFCGYLADKTPMQAERIKKQLSKLIRYPAEEKTVITDYANFLTYQIYINGATPETSVYKTSTGKQATEYLLSYPENLCATINKTQYDFAVYLWKNFKDPAECQNADTAESERLEAIRAEELRAEQERQRAEEKAQAEREEFENACTVRVKSLIGTNIEELKNRVFSAIYGNYASGVINAFPLKLYFYAENIENPLAKEELKSWLSLHNKASVKLFEMFTGLKMPATLRDRENFIDGLTYRDIDKLMPVKVLPIDAEDQIPLF